ncbi:MAG: translocation/assembly module TamB [Bacteroidales bacterium]|nr:translocation/assembly module TamB [Bacteroidales bacterium]
MKKGTDAKRLALRIPAVLLLVAVLCLFLLENGKVQTALVRRAISSIENEHMRIQVGSIKVVPFSVIIVDDILVTDADPYLDDPFGRGYSHTDTLFCAGRICATFNLKGLTAKDHLRLGRVRVDDCSYFLQMEPWGKDRRRAIGTLGRCLNSPPPSETHVEAGDLFEIRKAEMNNFRFTMRTFSTPKPPYGGSGVNWGFIDARASKLKAHGIAFLDSRLNAIIDFCSFSEVNGPSGTISDATIRVGMGEATVRGMTFTDAESELHVDEYKMSYPNPYAFQDFPDSVRIDALVTDSHLTLRTLSSFIGGMDNVPLGFDVERFVAGGTVNDMHILEARAVEDSGIGIDIEAVVRNLFKDIPLEFSLNPRDIRFTTAQLENAVGRVTGQPAGISELAPGHTIDLKFNSGGTFEKFDFSAEATMDGGKVGADMNFRKLPRGNGISLAGNVSLDEVDLGVISGNNALGRATLHFDGSSIFGKNTRVKVSNLEVDKLTALGYAYSGISGNGIFTGKRFDGKIVSRDPNLNFIFQGIFDFAEHSSDKLYKFFATIAYADLKALNLDKSHSVSELSTGVISANLRSMDKGNALVGEASAKGLQFTDNSGHHDLGDITVTSQITPDAYRVQLESPFAKGGYIGNGSFSDVIGSIVSSSLERELPSLFTGNRKRTGAVGDTMFNLRLDMHDSNNLLSLIKPGLYIADGTSLTASMDSSGVIVSSIESPRIAMGESYIKNLRFKADNSQHRVNVRLRGDETKAGPFQLLNTSFDATAHDDALTANLDYAASGSDDYGKLNLIGEFSSDRHKSLLVDIRNNGSELCINGQDWDMSPWNIRMTGNGTEINGFRLASGSQEIIAEGLLSKNETGLFEMDINSLDLGILAVVPNIGIGLGGQFNADARIVSPRSGISGINADISVKDLTVNGEKSGDLAGRAGFTGDNALEIHLDGIDPQGRNGLTADASLHMDTKDINGSATFDGFDIGPIDVFAREILEDAEGKLDGMLTISGTTDSPEIRCDSLTFRDGYAVIRQTGMKYGLDGLLAIDEDGPYIREFNISDGIGGVAKISGRIPGTEMSIQRLKVLDKSDEGDGLFGSLSIDGDVSLRGENLSAMEIDANISTSGEGLVNVNVSGTADYAAATSSLSFLTGKETSMDEEVLYAEKLAYNGNGGTDNTSAVVRAAINVSPEVEIVLGLDQDGTNMLTTRGNGLINLGINTSGSDNGLSGNYDIQSGKYHLSVLGTLVNKDFTIQQGSSLRFGGDLLDTEFDVKAVHSLRASLGPLISDTTSVSTQRTVNCGISITDKLRSPELEFSIDIPDLDPTTSSLVQSELNTEDKVQRQFIGLLVTGSFIPSEQGGGVVNNTGSNILYKNLSMIMSGQLNSILQKLGIPVDLGLNYQQNEAGKDIFDVAISTQMFNNRVLVNGTIGNRQFSTRSNEEMVGDIDVQIKLDRTGNTRMSLFSHSADDYTNYLDNTQRSGVGISYQKEFNRLGDLFKRKKKKDE